MEKVTAIRIKQPNNTYSDEIPIGVSVQNVNWDNSYNLKQILGNININKGTVQQQIDNIISSIIIDSQLSDESTYPVQNRVLKQILDTKMDKGDLTKTSQLTNDSGFLTENSAVITSINRITGAVTINLESLETRVAELERIVSSGGVGGGESSNPTITIDSQLSDESTNPVQNKIIKQALDSLGLLYDNLEGDLNDVKDFITDYGVRITDLETIISNGGGSGGPIAIDDYLSDESTRPVQNKVIKQALDEKVDSTISINVNEQTNTMIIQNVP